LVEAAIVMPIFFLMVAGTIQFGNLYTSLIVLRNASAVAARAAVLGTDETSIEVCDAARRALNTRFDPDLLECSTSPAILPTSVSTPVTVTLSYPVPLFSVGSGAVAGTTWTLTAQTVMQ
jgi:Flp pilus assembly protein TadG